MKWNFANMLFVIQLMQQKKAEVQIHEVLTQSSVEIYKQQSKTAAAIGQSVASKIM